MIKKLKMKYAKFLFKKYGWDTGAFFEKIPWFYKINPLFSPSVYTMLKGKQIHEWFMKGLEEGMKIESPFQNYNFKVGEE